MVPGPVSMPGMRMTALLSTVGAGACCASTAVAPTSEIAMQIAAGIIASLWVIIRRHSIMGSLSVLNRVEIIQNCPDIGGPEHEFWHVGVPDGQALRQRLRQTLDRIFAGKGSKWRCNRMRADAGAADGMT